MPAGAVRVGAVDCGTNTLRLLIADVDPLAARPVRPVVREMRTVRLGEGIERTGEFAEPALRRTEVALAEYAALIERHGAGVLRMVATSASRDVRNTHRLVALVRAALGIDPEVISGDEEAELTFAGVRSGLELAGPSIVVDIGGGSTELIAGDSGGPRASMSTDVGVVRLTERHVHDDPPSAPQLGLVERDAGVALAPAFAAVGPLGRGALIGVAGTATTAAALARDLPSYDPALIHGSVTTYAEVQRVLQWSCSRDTAARVAHPAMHPGRAGVFPAGMVILDVVMRALGAAELVVSESDILDGIALSAAT